MGDSRYTLLEKIYNLDYFLLELYSFKYNFRKYLLVMWATAQVLREEDPSSILSTHMEVYNYSELQFQEIWHPFTSVGIRHACCTHIGKKGKHSCTKGKVNLKEIPRIYLPGGWKKSQFKRQCSVYMGIFWMIICIN